jgi:hypothetical protein
MQPSLGTAGLADGPDDEKAIYLAWFLHLVGGI